MRRLAFTIRARIFFLVHAKKMESLPKFVITIDDTRLGCFNKRLESSLGWKATPFRGLRKKKVGCTLSHLKLWRHIVRHKERLGPAVVIFEDDAACARPCTEADDLALRSFMQDHSVAVLQLGWSPFLRMVVRRTRRTIGNSLDAHAYVVKPSLLQRYLDAYGPMFCSISSITRAHWHQRYPILGKFGGHCLSDVLHPRKQSAYANIRDIDIANRSWFNHVCMRIFIVVNYIWIQHNEKVATTSKIIYVTIFKV